MNGDPVHLLESYGPAATRTLCGLDVPAVWGSARGSIQWARPGRETCAECQKAHRSRVGQLAGSPSPPTKKAHPLFQVVKKSGGSPP